MKQPFIFPLRVEIEDTDAQAVVYHSNYLNYMERARNAWCLSLGIRLDKLAAAGELIVMRRAVIDYFKPARFNDELEVLTTFALQRHSSAIAYHTIRYREQPEHILCKAEAVMVCVNTKTLRPRRFPVQLLGENIDYAN